MKFFIHNIFNYLIFSRLKFYFNLWHDICSCVLVHLICNMNVHMKNTKIKYKLNFKTMKKGLLTLLAASLVFVGCQNYDDQFDDLNAQISALKSQVDGLSSLSGQVASLSGTISGLQAGVTAAQSAANAAAAAGTAATAAAEAAGTAATAAGTEATAATAAATAALAAASEDTAATDLSGLEASLASLAADVAAVQASLATAATAASVTALQAEIDAIESDLDELLSSSNIYSTDVTVTNATTLNAALALGNKINVLNATLTITGYTGMDYTAVQTLVNRVNTTTGNIVYRAPGSTATEIVFNNLVSAGDITVRQPGGYSFPKLANAGKIDLETNFTTTVTNVSFPVLTTATSIETDDAGTFTVSFASATNVDFGAIVTAPSNTITITTKKGATLDLGSWKSTDANGNTQNATLTLNGPASFTNGTAAGTFASTGLAGNTVGAVDGKLSFTNVETVAVHNFRGNIELETGVKSFTGNNIVSVGTTTNPLTDAVSLENVDITMIRDNDPGNLAATTLANTKSAATNNGDLLFTDAHAKLASATITGPTGHIKFTSLPALTTVDLTSADAFDVHASGNAVLASWTDASKAEDRVFDNNDLMTSVTLSATTKLTATADKAVSVSVDGNAELTSLTISMDDVEDLSITDNPKLATIAATGLADNGTSTSASAAVYNNAFVASSVKDTYETAATRADDDWAQGGSLDAGSITTDSGLKTLGTWADHALDATTGTVSIWFDTITKLETQSEYGGAYTDNTSDLTDPAATPTGANAIDYGNYTAYFVLAYGDKGTPSTERTYGVRSSQIVSYAYDVNFANNSLVENELGSLEEGITITTAAGDFIFDEGDSYTGAANGSTVETVGDLVKYINADSTVKNSSNIEVTAAQDSFKKGLYTLTYTDSTLGAATLGTLSTLGNGQTSLMFQFGTNHSDGKAKYLTATVGTAFQQDDIANAIMTAIHADADYSATTVTSAGSNVFQVTNTVSGTATQNTSPLRNDFPAISFVVDAAQTSTTAYLTPSSYNVTSNKAGSASSLFSLASSSADVRNGLRITLKNLGGTALPAATTVVVSGASNTAIATSTGAADGVNGLIVAGVNIPSYVADTYEGPGDYVTAFSALSAGTDDPDGVAKVDAKTTNHTGW
jgi:hypothetical protein